MRPMTRPLAIVFVLGVLGATAWGDKAKPAPKDAITLGPFGYPNQLDALAFTVTRSAKQMKVVVALTLSTTKQEKPYQAVRKSIMLELPARARLVGFASTIGGKHNVAVPEVKGEAWTRFVDHVHADREVALVDFGYATEGRAHYQLGVAPMYKGSPVELEIEIEMQVAKALVIRSRSPATATLVVDGSEPETTAIKGEYVTTRLALPTAAAKPATLAAASDAVNEDISFLAEPALPPRDDDIIVRETRAQARANLDALHACFPKPVIMWNVDLTFTVTDGVAADVAVTQQIGDQPGPIATACVARALAKWKFTSIAKPTPVTYRLHVP
jgi:hypothetical protein